MTAIQWREAGLHAALGAVTGVLSALSLEFDAWSPWTEGGVAPGLHVVTVGPGVVFGVAFGLLWWARGRAEPWRAAAYAVAAAASYYCAVWLVIAISEAGTSAALVGVAAGLVGAALLSGAGAALFAWQRRPRPLAASVLAGAVLGALLANGLDDLSGLLALFVPWQAAYAAAIGAGFTRPAG